MTNLQNLTVIIVTYRTNHDILDDCIKSIDQNVKILIIENSDDVNFKEKYENKFNNVSVILAYKNLGYGAGNNFGFENIKTRYGLISNPDVVYKSNFFEEIDKYLIPEIEFNIIGVSYDNEENYLSYGSFDNKKNIILKEKNYEQNNLKEVDWVVGCSMLIDTSKINSSKLFDENIFLYFEEIDFCRQSKMNGGKVYSSSKLIVMHLGHKGSAATDPNYTIETEMFRNWHWMWSSFYYHKKYSSYFLAIKIMSGKFIKSFFKMIFFSIIYNKKKQTMYFARYSGLLNAFMGKKSWYRVKSLFK
jgi:GT2 family glycosyltransferase